MCMKPVLYKHPHIEVRQSPVHGYGVFATEDIGVDTILEEISFVSVPVGIASDYVFAFPRGGTPVEDTIGVQREHVLPFGYACIYNHSDIPNATWKTDTKTRLFVFYTISPIKKNEEIRTFYGPDSYWAEHPNVKKV